ncbi:MAG: hypothetical protein GC162_20680 [Planctomycetes bacterium]|nr:hypothetical protein [Planctomycetota bacterium]
MRRQPLILTAAAAAVLLAFAFAPRADAATITGTVTPIPTTTSFPLTSNNTLDWAYWNTTSTGLSSPLAPTNRKAGGSLISGVSKIGGSSLRGSSTTTRVSFAFSDGASPTNGPASNVSGIFNSTLNSNGVGVTLNVTLPTVDTYFISVWAGAFDGTVRFQATLPGATTFLNTAFTAGHSSPKEAALYYLLATPNSPGDVLTLNLTLLNTASTNAHVLLAGLAVVIPAPSAFPAGLSLLSLPLLRRRPRKHLR